MDKLKANVLNQGNVNRKKNTHKINSTKEGYQTKRKHKLR